MTDREAALAPHLELVRLLAEAVLTRRLNAGFGFADQRIPAEVYLRDDAARGRLRKGSLKPEKTHSAQAKEIAAAIDALRARLARHASPLVELAARFGLDDGARALLSIAVAYELDADVRDLIHVLAGRRRAALWSDLCQELEPALAGPAVLLAALHPNGPLLRAGLVDLQSDSSDSRRGGKSGGAIVASRRVLDWLLGDTRLAEPLHALMRIIQPGDELHTFVAEEVVRDIARVTAHLTAEAARGGGDGGGGDGDATQGGDRERAVVVLQGPLGSGRLAAAQALATMLHRPLAVIPLRELGEVEARPPWRPGELLRAALTEARLRGAVAYLVGIESLYGAEGREPDRLAVDAIAQYDDLLVVSTAARGMPSMPFRRAFHLVRMPRNDLADRERAWTTSLAVLGELAALEPDAAAVLAGRYVIGAGTIGDVVTDARAFGQATGKPIERLDIEEAVGRRLSLRLGSFGTLITRRARFAEMVLPEDVVQTLHDMIAMVSERTKILEKWGYQRHLGISRGVSALFSGEPGTGKTMAASVISSELGLELMRIDLSAVVSKWVGETEKHLAKIFDEAQSASAMLLFDEADSLFGKRTEVKTAQDRYANLEVNYILQRMEGFDGICVLTTNMESGIDQAFLRRLNFRIRFPEPEIEEREELWQRLLPPETALHGRVDFRRLAERFDMTGGHIRNAVVRAAVIAARKGREMAPEDLMMGAHLEYVELGKVMPEMDD